MVRGDGVEVGPLRKIRVFQAHFLRVFASSTTRVEWRGTERIVIEEQQQARQASLGRSGIDLQRWVKIDPPPPADQTATASDSAMDPPPPPAPMESDEEQDDESVPEVPGTTI